MSFRTSLRPERRKAGPAGWSRRAFGRDQRPIQRGTMVLAWHVCALLGSTTIIDALPQCFKLRPPLDSHRERLAKRGAERLPQRYGLSDDDERWRPHAGCARRDVGQEYRRIPPDEPSCPIVSQPWGSHPASRPPPASQRRPPDSSHPCTEPRYPSSRGRASPPTSLACPDPRARWPGQVWTRGLGE